MIWIIGRQHAFESTLNYVLEGMVDYFTSNEKLTDNELKVLSELDTPKNEGKTPSQKLRNSIYVLWDKQGRPKEFCQFYENYIEEFRNRILDQINKIEV